MTMKLYFFSLCTLFFLSSCYSPANTQTSDSEGCISSKLVKYSNDKIPAFSSTDTVWFKDNEIITQIRGIYFNTDTAGVFTIREYLMHYAYINYDEKRFALYRSFSDTAKCIKQYPTLDSLRVAIVTDYFGKSKKNLDSVISTKAMSDTSIKDVLYQRKRITQRWKNKDLIVIVYYRCDKPNSRFSIFKNKADSCAPVKTFDYDSDGTNLRNSSETEFLSDSLTTEEKEVFEAWRKQMIKQIE